MKETEHNRKRITANFPQASITTDDLNIITPYRKDFNANSDSVTLDVSIKETPTPCTISPPSTNSWVEANIDWGTWVPAAKYCDPAWGCSSGYLEGTATPFHSISSGTSDWDICTVYFKYRGYEAEIEIGRFYGKQEYLFSTTDAAYAYFGLSRNDWTIRHRTYLAIPEDGCYLIEVHSGSYGWEYGYNCYGGCQYWYEQGSPISGHGVNIYKNNKVIASGSSDWTGYLAILGPVLFYYPPVASTFVMVEAKYHDLISASESAQGYDHGHVWVAGAILQGYFLIGTGSIRITKLASAEGNLVPMEPVVTPVTDDSGADYDSTPPPSTAPPIKEPPPSTPPPPAGTGSLQVLINQTPNYGVLNITGYSYNESITIDKPMTLIGGYITSNSINGITITSSEVKLDRVTINGIGNMNPYGTGIYAYRADRLAISNCSIEDFPYAGIMVLETNTGIISANTVERIGMTVGGGGNAYGIALSNLGGSPTTNVDVISNTIDWVPNWHGLDTHAGVSCTFNDNIVSHCNRAIFITSDSYGNDADDIEISRNICNNPTPRDDVRNTYPYNEVGITVVTGCTNVWGDSNTLDGWPTGNAIDTQSSGAIFTNTIITNPV